MRAVKNGSAQTVTSGSDAVVTFIDDFDPQGWFASNKFQPTIAGYYNIDVSVWWNAGAVTNNQTNIQLIKNGTTQLTIDQAQILTGSGYGQTLSTIVYFNGTSDYVEVTAFTGNTTSQDINGAGSGTYIVANLIAYGSTGPQGPSGPSGPGATANANNIISGNTILEVTANSQVLSTNGFTVRTDSLSKTYIVRGITTNATETELFIDGANRIPVSANSTMFYTVDLVARRTDATDESAGFYLKGVVDNFSNTVADVGNLYEVIVARDSASYSVDARANNSTDTINIYVTGVAGKTIRWVGLVRTVEVAQ
jgi:hypothetical protein